MKNHQAKPFYSLEKIEEQKQMLANRVKKNFKHRQKYFRKQGTNAFRIYDRDIPEIRMVVDYYDGNLVLGEYVRTQTDGIPWLESMAESVSEALDIPMERTFLKRRQTKPGDGQRYHRLAKKDDYQAVQEGGLSFLVNLQDYIDTGLFFDHRLTRNMIRDGCHGKSFLNLFAYTGSFTCYAAKGGARFTTTVDISGKYIDWSRRNLAVNKLEDEKHEFIVSNVFDFIKRAVDQGRYWDLIILDPPSYSSRGEQSEFAILDDHPQLIKQTLQLLSSGGKLYFSTNHQAFIPNLDPINCEWEEITSQSLPEDYKGRTPHRLFIMTKGS